MIRCSKCGGRLVSVDSRSVDSDNSIIRRRRCENKSCNSIFYTKEVLVPFEQIQKDYNEIQNKYKNGRKSK